jgi:hypothetical protein
LKILWNSRLDIYIVESLSRLLYNNTKEIIMIKRISLIALVAIGIGALFLGTSHALAFAACTGNPHDAESGPTGSPQDTGDTGNPHDTVAPLGSHLGHEADTCNGAK